MDHAELDKEIRAAVAAHDEWNRRLTTAINLGSCTTAPSDIAVDDKCAFGQWLYGDLDEDLKAGKPYQVTKRLHADFHDVAARVAELAEAGRKGDAYALLDGEYSQKSSKLLRALTKWRGELEV
ncbi:MAG TPA: hypothetical protein ENK28_05880 [Aliiroseovarius sp.]|nr:hypothetical protein [Aliiroseovarius sp.]